MRFAVHRPGNPVASPRSHGVPRRDIPGRVHVSVERETAGYAGEEGLALTTLRCDVPARRAALTSERGTDLLHSAGRLIFQPAHQQPPARGQNAPVQPGFLSHIPARLGSIAPARACHVPDAQVLDAYHIEPACDLGGSLLDPVLPCIGLFCSQAGDGQPDSGAPIRATLGPRQPALKAAKPTLPHRTEAGNRKNFASRQRRARGHATVNAYGFAGTRRRDGGWDPGEGNIPAARAVTRDPVGLRIRGYSTRPAEPHPAHLGNPGLASFAAESAHVLVLDRDDTESLVPPGFSPSWRTMSARKEIRHCLGKVSQRLLLNHLATSPEPVILGASLGELATLLQVARCPAASWVPPGLLFDREVPDEAGMRAMFPQHCFLGSGGYQTVAGHSNIISIIGALPGKRSGVSSGHEQGAFHPRHLDVRAEGLGLAGLRSDGRATMAESA